MQISLWQRATAIGTALRRSRRFQLWLALAGLVLMVLGLLVFLTGRYEASQWQSRADADAAEAVQDLRSALNRHQQQFQALQGLANTPQAWKDAATGWMLARRDLRALEWRDAQLNLVSRSLSPFAFDGFGPKRDAREQPGASTEVALTCNAARRTGLVAYSNSYFMPETDGVGMELVELCQPSVRQGQVEGFTVAVFSLNELLRESIAPGLQRGQTIAMTEADGSRLAMIGQQTYANTRFVGTRLLDLPGNTMVLRIERGKPAPDALPNLLVAWVSLLSIALLSVLAMLLVDMRRRQKAEGELAQALAFRKAMEDSLNTGLRARDLQGRITYVNPAFCAMVGYAPSELVGSASPAPYWPSERIAEYEARQQQRFSSTDWTKTAARDGFESVFIRKDGTEFPVLIIEAPLLDAKSVHLGWMSAVIDTSKKRRAEAALRQQEDRLQAASRLATVGEMASLISHELNQPLAAISSYAEGAINIIATEDLNEWTDRQKRSKNPHEEGSGLIQDALERIAAQAARAGRVIRAVNDFVRRREQVRGAVGARALIDAVMPLIQLHARQTRTQLRVSCTPDLPPLACDRTLIEQVLLNLARNAMQAMDSPSCQRRTLHLQARRGDADRAEFRVEDTGPGIAPDAASHVFTEFFTTKRDGMGLGLSLCRTVVEQHGGQLRYETLSSHGTAFIFTLPFAHDPAHHPLAEGALQP